MGGVVLYASTFMAVDGIVAISGWFGIRFSWIKWFRLLGIYLFYVFGIFGLMLILHKLGLTSSEPPTSPHSNWFASAYLALMLLVPIINAGLEALAQTPHKLVSAWGLFALTITLSWSNHLTHLLDPLRVPNWTSTTVSTLIFVYVTLRTVRLTKWDERIGKWIPLAFVALYFGFIAYIALKAGFSWAPKGKISCQKIIDIGYHAPVMWMTAVAALLFFRRIHPPAWLTRIVCFLGPSMFGIYLFHESPLRHILFLRPEVWLHEHYSWVPAIAILLLCAAFTFVVSLCADLARRAGLSAIRWTWGKVTHTSATDKAPSPRLPD